MHIVRTLLASAALAATFGGTALARPAHVQPDTVNASLPTQLPRTAIPHHYALTVTPHADKLTFNGSVAIDLDVIKPTRTLVLNAADLAFAKASLSPSSGAVLTGRVSTDAETQKLTGVLVGDTLFYVATAQLDAIRPGGRVAPADSMRENVILRLVVPRP